jgi:hypothetical protein
MKGLVLFLKLIFVFCAGGGVASAAAAVVCVSGHLAAQGGAALWAAGLLQDPHGQGAGH